MIGPEAARLAAVASQLVRLAGHDEVSGIPAIEVLCKSQRDRGGNGANQQVVALSGQFFGDSAAGLGGAFVIANLYFNFATVHAALGVRFVDRELDGTNHFLALLGEHP